MLNCEWNIEQQQIYLCIFIKKRDFSLSICNLQKQQTEFLLKLNRKKTTQSLQRNEKINYKRNEKKNKTKAKRKAMKSLFGIYL